MHVEVLVGRALMAFRIGVVVNCMLHFPYFLLASSPPPPPPPQKKERKENPAAKI